MMIGEFSKKIKEAKREAIRFLNRVEEYEKKEVEIRYMHQWYMPKQSGALRRASMDLTRALADLRRHR